MVVAVAVANVVARMGPDEAVVRVRPGRVPHEVAEHHGALQRHPLRLL